MPPRSGKRRRRIPQYLTPGGVSALAALTDVIFSHVILRLTFKDSVSFLLTCKETAQWWETPDHPTTLAMPALEPWHAVAARTASNARQLMARSVRIAAPGRSTPGASGCPLSDYEWIISIRLRDGGSNLFHGRVDLDMLAGQEQLHLLTLRMGCFQLVLPKAIPACVSSALCRVTVVRTDGKLTTAFSGRVFSEDEINVDDDEAEWHDAFDRFIDDDEAGLNPDEDGIYILQPMSSLIEDVVEYAAHANFVYDDVVGGQVITRVCLDFMEKRDGGGGGGFTPDWFESYLSLDATWE